MRVCVCVHVCVCVSVCALACLFQRHVQRHSATTAGITAGINTVGTTASISLTLRLYGIIAVTGTSIGGALELELIGVLVERVVSQMHEHLAAGVG